MKAKIRENIITLFSITEKQADLFLSYFTLISLKRNEIFLREGDICQKVGLIEQGLMKCAYNQDGREVIEEFVFENSFITNYYSFLKEIPSEKEIRCLENCRIYVIHRNVLEHIGKEHKFIHDMARIMNEKLFLQTQDRLKSHLLDSATKRYLRLIHNRKDLVERIPQYLLASYLNINPETVSRIRKKIMENDFLDLDQSKNKC